MVISCIYKIQSTIDDRCYIGSAVNFKSRKSDHLKLLRKGIHHSKKLQHFFWKYGEKCIQFLIIEECEKSKLIEREQFWIDYYQSYEKTGFNICKIAGSTYGRILSEETKDKIRKKAVGRKQSDEQISQRVQKNTGKKRPKSAVILTTLKTQKLTQIQAEEIRMKLEIGFTQNEMAKEYGVCQRTISRIKQGISYKGELF